MLTVFGIRQCDTCRKALKWLEAKDKPHQFHDFRVDGLDETLLGSWLQSDFADRLVNRRSSSWRQLDETRKAVSGDELKALLFEIPTLIKRPVFCEAGRIIAVGFKPGELEELI